MYDALGIKEKGVLINEVFENAPAQKAGIQSGDVVLSLAGKKTLNPNELRNIAASLVAGQKYPIEIIRDGKKKTLTVIPTARGTTTTEATKDGEKSPAQPENNKHFGMSLKETQNALIVEDVEVNSICERAGIRISDIILSVKIAPDKPFIDVKTVKEFNKEVKDAKSGALIIRLSRNGQKFFVTIKPEK
jgi:S1-C subfamily serine protease